MQVTRENTIFLKGLGILLIAFHNYFHWVHPSPGENEFDFSRQKTINLFHLLGWETANYDKGETFWQKVLSVFETFSEPWLVINALSSFFGHYGVPLFVLLSAYGLARGYQDKKYSWLSFLVKRLSKLYPTFLLAIGLLLLLILFRKETVPDLAYFRALLWKLLFIHAFIPKESLSVNGPWWFYSLIVQLYVLFPILLGIHKKFPRFGMAIVTLASIVFGLTNGLDMAKGLGLDYYALFPIHLPQFCLGIFLACSGEKVRWLWGRWAFCGGIVLMGLGNWFEWAWHVSFLGSAIVLLIGGLWAERFLRNKFQAGWSLVVFYGGISMTLFAIHGFLRGPFVNLSKTYESTFWTFVFSFCFVLVATLFAKGVMRFETWIVGEQKSFSTKKIEVGT